MTRAVLWSLLLAASGANAAQWVEIGADTQAKYYVDVDSIQVEGETVRLTKRGVYTHTLMENLGGKPTQFKETLGVVELDCGRRINRVIRIDMVSPDGEVAWSSGRMHKRMWEEVQPNTHGEATLDFVCGMLGRTK
jgi:hypothetical protein